MKWNRDNIRAGFYLTPSGSGRRVLRVFQTYADMELSFTGLTTAHRVRGTVFVETDARLDGSTGVHRASEGACSFASWANANDADWVPEVPCK